MWCMLSVKDIIKIGDETCRFLFLVLVLLISILGAIYWIGRETPRQQELLELQEGYNHCKKLQVDYQGLSDAFRSGGWGRPQVQSLWNASGCQKVLDEWAKHDPCSQ